MSIFNLFRRTQPTLPAVASSNHSQQSNSAHARANSQSYAKGHMGVQNRSHSVNIKSHHSHSSRLKATPSNSHITSTQTSQHHKSPLQKSIMASFYEPEVPVLPDGYAQILLDLELQMEFEDTKSLNTIKQLNEMYKIGIEYYSHAEPRKSEHFKRKLTLLFSNPDTLRILEAEGNKNKRRDIQNANNSNHQSVSQSNSTQQGGNNSSNTSTTIQEQENQEGAEGTTNQSNNRGSNKSPPNVSSPSPPPANIPTSFPQVDQYQSDIVAKTIMVKADFKRKKNKKLVFDALGTQEDRLKRRLEEREEKRSINRSYQSFNSESSKKIDDEDEPDIDIDPNGVVVACLSEDFELKPSNSSSRSPVETVEQSTPNAEADQSASPEKDKVVQHDLKGEQCTDDQTETLTTLTDLESTLVSPSVEDAREHSAAQVGQNE